MMLSYDRIVFIILFLATLNSFLWFGLPIISLSGFVIGLVFIFSIYRTIQISRGYALYVVIVFAILSFVLIGNLLYQIQLDPKRIAGLFVMCFSLIISPLIFQYAKPSIIKSVILIHVFFFYAQFLLYYLFGIYIDYLVIAESYSRNFGGSYKVPIINTFIRPSGLYAEPGNYTNFMFLLYALHCIVGKNYGEDFKGIFFYLFVLSLVLCFSAFGMVFFVLIIFSRVKTLRSILSLLPPILLFSVVVAPFFIERFLGFESSMDSSGLGFRYVYLIEAMSNFESLQGLLVGKGVLSAPSFFQAGEGSDNDSGLILFMLREMGVVVTMTFLIASFLGILRLRLPLIIIGCLVTKLTPFMFFVPLVYSHFLSPNVRRKAVSSVSD